MNNATPEGTRRYAQRMNSNVARGHFRERDGLLLSSIGLGTYLGHWDEHTDRNYHEAIKRAVELGCNVIDSAINYRFQRSERVIGGALKQLFDGGKASRDEIIVATKGGFFPFEDEPPRDARGWIIENVIDKGLARPEEIAAGSHCMTPAYLEDQLTRSLTNLGLETIDIYYVHNPESQLEAVNRDEFDRRLRAAFEFLERAASDGRIGCYGTATWNGFRQQPGSTRLSVAYRSGSDRARCRRRRQSIPGDPVAAQSRDARSAHKCQSAGGRRATFTSHGRFQARYHCHVQRIDVSGEAKPKPAAIRGRGFERVEHGRSTRHSVCPIDSGGHNRTGRYE